MVGVAGDEVAPGLGRVSAPRWPCAQRQSRGLKSSSAVDNVTLTMEQQFRIEAAHRKLDDCNDIVAIRELAKQLLVLQETERAVVRQALVRQQICKS